MMCPGGGKALQTHALAHSLMAHLTHLFNRERTTTDQSSATSIAATHLPGGASSADGCGRRKDPVPSRAALLVALFSISTGDEASGDDRPDAAAADGDSADGADADGDAATAVAASEVEAEARDTVAMGVTVAHDCCCDCCTLPEVAVACVS